jgi:hypothetical protein
VIADKDRRYRRIIDSYRTALREVDPHACRLVDARMAEFGEGWISEGDKPVDVNALLSVTDIAKQFGFQPWDIKNWARRHPDKIPAHRKGQRVFYRVGDVLAYQAMM